MATDKDNRIRELSLHRQQNIQASRVQNKIKARDSSTALASPVFDVEDHHR
jgi:hypothetical protein